MYLWKYWRESRVTFAVAMLVAVMFFWLILKRTFGDPTFTLGAGFAFPASFVAWRYGSFGVGRNLDEESGSYLFSRPRSRAFFVWRDWGFGLVQLAMIVIAVNVLAAAAGYLRSSYGSPHRDVWPVAISVPSAVALDCTRDLLLVALVFGVTYFSTVLIKLKGLMLSAGVLLGYIVAKPTVRHYWPSIHLPSPMLAPFTLTAPGKLGLADHLGPSIAIRLALALIFPFIVIQLLERRDIG
jgi:hypothetical protein